MEKISTDLTISTSASYLGILALNWQNLMSYLCTYAELSIVLPHSFSKKKKKKERKKEKKKKKMMLACAATCYVTFTGSGLNEIYVTGKKFENLCCKTLVSAVTETWK